MNRKRIKVIILAMLFFIVAGVSYKAGRPDIRISRESRTDFARWSRTELSESSEGGVDSELCQRVYDSLDELEHDVDLPYVDETVFKIIKAAYAKVDFEGEFDKGNPDTYEEYREIFQRLVCNEVTYLDIQTGEEVYLKDCALFGYLSATMEMKSSEYIFFDIEGDGSQELCIRHNGRAVFFKYDPEKQKIISWYPGSDESWGAWETLIGTGKVQNNPLMKYYCFYQYDESGKEVCNTYLSLTAISEENIVYLVRMPEYADREGEEVPEEIKSQGSFERYRGKRYFRITEEQYEELLQPHWDAYETAEEKIKEVTYTYEEFLE